MPHKVYCSVSGYSLCAAPDGKGTRSTRDAGRKFRAVPLWLFAVLTAGVIGLGYVAPAEDADAMVCSPCRLEALSRRGKFKQAKKCCCVSECPWSATKYVSHNPTPLHFVQPAAITKMKKESADTVYHADLAKAQLGMTPNPGRIHNFVCSGCHAKIRSARDSATASAATQRGHEAHSKLVPVQGASWA